MARVKITISAVNLQRLLKGESVIVRLPANATELEVHVPSMDKNDRTDLLTSLLMGRR